MGQFVVVGAGSTPHMADPTGFEPAIFSVTRRRVNRATPRVRHKQGQLLLPQAAGLRIPEPLK